MDEKKVKAMDIVRRLHQAGHEALFAGGCVRDMVRGAEPRDYDIATSARPGTVQDLFEKTVAVGAQFGVVMVLAGGHQYEVATFRSDEAYVDGRHPTDVHFGSPEEDAQRRDFTINGMFFDPVTGRYIDLVGGRSDIDKRIVRTIGDPRARFTEDKLRLLRCVRFAANLKYEIEAGTWSALRDMAAEIGVVSAERIRDELVKILTRGRAGRGLELLEASGLLREILPEVAAMKGVEQPPEFHPEGDVFEHVKMMLDRLPEDPGEVLALSVLLHDVGKPPTFKLAADRIRFHGHDRVGEKMAGEILRRLKFPNEVIEKVSIVVGEHMRIREVRKMRPAKVKRILARDTYPIELELHRLDCLASHGSLENVEFLEARSAEWPEEVIRPAPLVTGRDLLGMGFEEGPSLGQVLQEIRELQLEEQIRTREEALAHAQTVRDRHSSH